MTVEEACRRLCPPGVADSIIEDMGVHWAVVAAVADTANHDSEPDAIKRVREHLAAQKQSH